MFKLSLPASLVCVALAVCGCDDSSEDVPMGFSANRSKVWKANGLAAGQIFAYAGNPIKASRKTPDGAFANGTPIGTISASGAFKITLPKPFPFSNEAAGLRTYCTSGLDFEFRAGYSCYSSGQDDAHLQRNTCTNATEAQVQNIRLAAQPMNGEARSATTVAELSMSTTYPYAIVVVDHPTRMNGCSNCFFTDETTGLTTDRYTLVCYESQLLPADTLLGVFRANSPHIESQTLAVRVRPLVAADLKYLAISGEP